jgi:hypothetical protein
MGIERLENADPTLYSSKPRRNYELESTAFDETVEDPIDAVIVVNRIYKIKYLIKEEIFEYIRDINDPEHPYTLVTTVLITASHLNSVLGAAECHPRRSYQSEQQSI